MPLSYSYLDEMEGADMSEDEFEGMFYPTAPNPHLPVRVVPRAEAEPPCAPGDAFDAEEDETLVLDKDYTPDERRQLQSDFEREVYEKHYDQDEPPDELGNIEFDDDQASEDADRAVRDGGYE